MSVWALLGAAAVLSVERACYVWIARAPDSFRRFCAWPAMAWLGAPIAIVRRLFCGFKALQVLVFAWWCYTHGGGVLAPGQGGAVVVAVAAALMVAGQALNVTVFYRLGSVGVFYGDRFGHKVPWCRAFPFSVFAHPQYVGAVMTIWGLFAAMRFPIPTGWRSPSSRRSTTPSEPGWRHRVRASIAPGPIAGSAGGAPADRLAGGTLSRRTPTVGAGDSMRATAGAGDSMRATVGAGDSTRATVGAGEGSRRAGRERQAARGTHRQAARSRRNARRRRRGSRARCGSAASPAGPFIPEDHRDLPVPSLDAWERYEGMAIQIAGVLTLTETFNLGSFGEVVLATARLDNPTNVVDPGTDAIARQAFNDRSRIIVDDGTNRSRQNLDPAPYPENGGLAAGDPLRTVRVGDRVNVGAPLLGVLDQRFGTYRIQPTGALVFDPPDNPRPAQPAAVGGRIRVASFNVLNYFTTLDTGAPVCGPTGGLDCRGANTPEEFARQRAKIISALAALNAHVVGLIELENNPAASLQDLVAGLNAATQPGRYAFIDTGTIGTDAIKLGFIYQPAIVAPVGAFAALNAYAREHPIRALTDPAFSLPGFPANANAAYTNLVGQFLGDEAYSYVFEGQSGYLDHALANRTLTPLVTAVTEWHINADEPVALGYNVEWTATIMKTANQQATLYAPDPFRSSDHDPLLMGLNPLCGDLDDDGDVDGRDLRAMLAAVASRSEPIRADYNADGRVDGRDLAIWLRCEAEFLLGRFVGGDD